MNKQKVDIIKKIEIREAIGSCHAKLNSDYIKLAFLGWTNSTYAENKKIVENVDNILIPLGNKLDELRDYKNSIAEEEVENKNSKFFHEKYKIFRGMRLLLEHLKNIEANLYSLTQETDYIDKNAIKYLERINKKIVGKIQEARTKYIISAKDFCEDKPKKEK